MRELPEERQQMIARVILDFASHDVDEIYRLADDEREAVRVGLEQAERGEFVSDAEMQAFRNRHHA